MTNIAEILKDCPKGTKLYSPIFEKCTLKEVLNHNIVLFIKCNKLTATFNQYGQYYGNIGECLLFPSKDNRDWSTFKKPCAFKPFDKVVARFASGTWSADLFSHYNDEMNAYITIGGVQYDQCFPYNEETAKLIGTDIDYKE